MFSHYSIQILPFEGQGSAQKSQVVNKNISKNPVQQKTASKPRVNFAPIEKKPVLKKPAEMSTAYKSGNMGIMQLLSPEQKTATGTEEIAIDERNVFSAEELEREMKLFAHKKKKEEGADSLFSTLTSSRLTIHDQTKLKLHVLNAVQTKQLDLVKIELLNHLRTALKNGALTFEYAIDESSITQTAPSSTDKKSQFDQLAADNPSLEKFRKLFNLDIDY